MAQPQPPAPAGGGFNWNNLSTGQKILGISSLVLVIVLFLPGWESYDTGLGDAFENIPGVGDVDTSFAVNAFTAAPGISWLAWLAALAVVVWEAMIAFGVKVNMGNASPALISAIAGGVAALMTLITFVMSLEGVGWAAFLGLIVGLAVGYGAFMRFQESKVGAVR